MLEHARDPRAPANEWIPILTSFGEAELRPWSAPGLYKAIKATLGSFADQLQAEEGAVAPREPALAAAHAQHACLERQERAMHRSVPVQVVQNNVRHASIGTTSSYLTTEREARLQAMEGFWGQLDNG